MSSKYPSDNDDQIQEILNFCHHLEDVVGQEINQNIAAEIWIKHYAESWRNRHPLT
ncbi:MAG: hypothetical protein OCD01_01705 [Fibrobacterales bacterium]